MENRLFALVILIHGLIHFKGFFKAYSYGSIEPSEKKGSKLLSAFWFLTGGLFVTTVILLLHKNEWWLAFGITATILSQLLLINSWRDARFGTVVNVIVLLVAIPDYGNLRFQKIVNKEARELLATITAPEETVITKDMLQGLPVTIQKWLTRCGVIDKERIYFVRLKQKVAMRPNPGGKCLHFRAERYISPQSPALVWHTKMQMIPPIYMNTGNKPGNNTGKILIKDLSWPNVTTQRENTQMKEGILLLYLSEICWFPSAALNKYIKWEAIDSHSVKATVNYMGSTVSGVFEFDKYGDMINFSAIKYYSIKQNAVVEKWLVETAAYKVYNGIRIPAQSKITWKTTTGKAGSIALEITDLEFNSATLYK